jgi:hypothetical protein
MNNQSTESYRMNRSEAAKYLDISPGTLAVWATTKTTIIPYSKIGRRVVYDRADLDRFLAENKVGMEAA